MEMVEKEKKPLLLIGIFFWETMGGAFFARCLQMIEQLFQMSQAPSGAIAFKMSICAHKSRMQAKTELVEEALRTDAKWVMFLDDKLEVGANIIKEMIAMDKDIVNISHVFANQGTALRSTCFSAGKLMSCSMVKTEVFRQLEESYFLSREERRCWISENTFFASKAKEKGYKITNMEYCTSPMIDEDEEAISQINICNREKKRKLLVVVPVAETVSSQFVGQFFGIVHHLLNRYLTDKDYYSIAIYSVYETEIAWARTKMVEEAKRVCADKILWIDSDSLVSVEDVEKLLDSPRDVVSGITVQKSAPYLPVVLKNEDGFLNLQVDVETGKGLIEVDAVGMGLTMTKTKVFDKIKKPFFMVTRHELPDGSVDYEGEDVYMSRKLADAGVKLYVDTDVCYGHIGKIATIQDYNVFSREKLVYLKECREKSLAAIGEFLDGEYDTHQLKLELMKMKKKIKEAEEELLTGEEWIFEQADWHLYGEQWERDYAVAAQVINLCRKYGCLKVLCLDRGIGQLPLMLMRAAVDVDCLDIAEANLPEHQAEMIRNLYLQEKINIVSLKQLTKNYYDVILAVDWFEHLNDEDFGRHIEALREIVKPNSELIVACAPHNDRHRHYQWTADRKQAVMELKNRSSNKH